MLTRRQFLASAGSSAALVAMSPLRAVANEKDPEPLWTTVPVLQDTEHQRLGVALADIDSRLPATGLVSSETMRDSDLVTWAHEATHGVNSIVRNHYAPAVGIYNAAYVLGGRAAVIKEPRPVTLQEVARYIPSGLRDHSTYNLYMVEQARQWNQEPLYVLDEWSAYMNGAIQYLNMLRAGIRLNRVNVLLNVAHFSIYSLCVVVAVDAAQRSGRIRYDETQLRLFVAWQWNRMMQLFAAAVPHRGFTDPISYYRKFAIEPVGASLRRWSRGYFGRTWVSTVMRTASD